MNYSSRSRYSVRPIQWRMEAPFFGSKDSIYRFFREAEHADALAAGYVWLSTFETCRGYESAQRGDVDEGTLAYYIGDEITGDGSDPRFVAQAKQAGIVITPQARSVTIKQILASQRIRDAYVFCCTADQNERFFTEFGEHCVRVRSPGLFLRLVTRALVRSNGVIGGMGMPVIYGPRVYRDLESAPGPLAFLKPADPYGWQKEIRMVWDVPANAPIRPVSLFVPRVQALVERVR